LGKEGGDGGGQAAFLVVGGDDDRGWQRRAAGWCGFGAADEFQGLDEDKDQQDGVVGNVGQAGGPGCKAAATERAGEQEDPEQEDAAVDEAATDRGGGWIVAGGDDGADFGQGRITETVGGLGLLDRVVEHT
jgi:hypothetical protein